MWDQDTVTCAAIMSADSEELVSTETGKHNLSIIQKLPQSSDVIRDNDVITRALMITSNNVVTVSPRDFGIRNIRITKYRKLISTTFYKPQKV